MGATSKQDHLHLHSGPSPNAPSSAPHACEGGAEGADVKQCVVCGEYMGLRDGFYKSVTGKDGFENRCKRCRLAQQYRRLHELKAAEKTKQYQCKYYAKRAEHFKQKSRCYRAEHPTVVAETECRYRDSHPNTARVKRHNRRALEHGASGSHTTQDVQAQYDRQAGRCYWCQEKVGDKFHVDHVTPLSKGGSNGPENLVIACPACNRQKSDKHPMDFAGRLL